MRFHVLFTRSPSDLEYALSPLPTKATNKPIDSSARKPLIYIGVGTAACGLQLAPKGNLGERICRGESETHLFSSNVARPEVRKNPREPSQTRGSGQKKANPRGLAFRHMVVDG